MTGSRAGAAVGLAIALITALLAGPAAAAPLTTGAAGIGDYLFPTLGNPGYDARHYTLDLRYATAAPAQQISGVLRMDAVATAKLSSFNLDFAGDSFGLEMATALNQAGELKSLGHRPLAVVTAVDGAQAGWPGQQDDLATLSTNSAHRVLATATHDSLVSDKGDAAKSSDAILDLIKSVRTARPLAQP